MAKASIASLLDYVSPHCLRTSSALPYVPQIPAANQWGYQMGKYGQIATSGKWKGRKVADCNGLFEDDLARQLGGNHNTLSRYNYRDWCKGHNGSDMSQMPQIPGCAVFRADDGVVQHVGMLWRKIGPGVKDWLVLEAANSEKGYICSKMGSAWNRWGLMKAKYVYDVPGEAPEPPATPTMEKHTVVPGDRLWNIAIKYGLPGEDWVRIRYEHDPNNPNPIEPSKLQVGKVVLVPTYGAAPQPPAVTEKVPYLVKRGDRLWNISIAHGRPGKDWVLIRYADDHDNPSPLDPAKLQVGKTVLVPKKTA
jgi:hypothetical protein